MVLQYRPAVNVSPFIRFCRWSLLLTGIGYGFLWDRRYAAYEAKMGPVWAKEKAERDAFLKAEKERNSKLEIEELERLGK